MKAVLAHHRDTVVAINKVIAHPGALRHKTSLVQRIANTDKLIVPDITGFTCHRFEDVIYLKAQSNYTEVFTRTKRILVSRTLKALNCQLPDTLFHRVHKSYVVNVGFIKSYIRTVDDSHLVLEDDTCIPVSRSKRAQIR
jgi:two-component system LytT family response regulator